MDLDTERSCATKMSQPVKLATPAKDASRISKADKNVPMYFFSNSPVKWRWREDVYQATIAGDTCSDELNAP